MIAGPDDGGRPADDPRLGSKGEASATIVAALDRLRRAQRMHRQAVASSHGLSTLQVDLLLTVATAGPPQPTVGALARELGVRQPTVTDSLRALERKHLTARAPSTTDRRRRVVTLTTSGLRLVGEVDRADEAVRAVIDRMDPTARGATLRALLEVIAGFVDAGIIEVARTCLTCRFHRITDTGTDHCTLLETDLAPGQLRADCPDHMPTTT